MDLLSRCNIEFENIRSARARATSLGSLVGKAPPNAGVAILGLELATLDRVLYDRAHRLLIAVQRFESTGQGAEEVELDVELVAHLERKVLALTALLARELNVDFG